MDASCKPACTGRRFQQGFTLTELMVTLTIIGIALAIGVPSYSSMIATQRVRNVSSDLSTAVMMARSEAVKQNTIATISTPSSWTTSWTVSVGASTVRAFGPYSGITIASSVGNTLSIGNDGRPTATGKVTFQVTPPSAVGQAVSPVCVQVNGTGSITQTSGACS